MSEALVLLWLLSSRGPIYGQATYYDPGLMQIVALNRGMDLTWHIGGVSLNRKADLGRTVWLEHEGQLSGPWLVVDCAARKDYPERVRQGYVAEVPYWLALIWNMRGPVPITIHFRRPPE